MRRFRVTGRRGGLIAAHATLKKVRAKLPAWTTRFGRVTVARVLPARPFTMYDSVTVPAIPADAVAAAGYVGGHWPTFANGSLRKQCPHAKLLSIAVNASEDAECLDVERGDATPAQAAAWVKRQLKRGVKKPVVYTSVSQARTVLLALAHAGISRGEIRLWTAHYTGRRHRCTSSCGFGFTGRADATQYTDKALGRNLDASLCAPDFL